MCISILHAPGEDQYGYEAACERWLPIHTVETIVLSVIAMLSDPNDASPANIDAAVRAAVAVAVQRAAASCADGGIARLQKEWRENRELFKRKVQRCVRKTQESL